MTIKRILAAATFAALTAMPALAQSGSFPARPITLLVPFAPGGSSDVVMRLVAAKVAESIKQTIVIENRPGGGGNVAALAIKNAEPDGYTLMMGHTGTHAINATLYPDLKFDPVKDFTPITALISFNNILVVPVDSPAKSAKELAALAKSRPDGLTYASQGVGTGGHLLGVIFAKETGTKLVHVPYRGVAPAVTDMAAGRVDMMFSSYLTSSPQIKAGKLRMLAIAGAKRHPAIPDLPTMGEAGFPDVAMEQWFGLFGPAGMPDAVVRLLNREFVAALNSEDVKKTLLPQGSVIIPSTSEELGARVKHDVAALGKVVTESGAKPAE